MKRRPGSSLATDPGPLKHLWSSIPRLFPCSPILPYFLLTKYLMFYWEQWADGPTQILENRYYFCAFLHTPQ